MERLALSRSRARARRSLRKCEETRLHFNVKSLCEEIKQCNRARQNRTFAKRYLERRDCAARSPAEHGKGEFLRLSLVRYEIECAAKRGETTAQASNLAEQRSGSATGLSCFIE